MDYRQFANLETYIFKQVGPRYRKTRELSTFDFFCIIIWKANRSKSKIAKKLLKKGKSLDKAIRVISQGLALRSKPEEKMRYLVEEWSFRLPMASAILTALYPKDFTVYDVRVCEILGNFSQLNNITNFDNLWRLYDGDFKRAVKKAVPLKCSLREKDYYLWGKSFYQQLSKNIKNNFLRK